MCVYDRRSLAGRIGSIAVTVGCALLTAIVLGQDRSEDFNRQSVPARLSLLWKLGVAGQPTQTIVLDPYTGYRSGGAARSCSVMTHAEFPGITPSVYTMVQGNRFIREGYGW